ncbi:MAG: radical SAM protein [Gammaproteobacteria bacterium]
MSVPKPRLQVGVQCEFGVEMKFTTEEPGRRAPPFPRCEPPEATAGNKAKDSRVRLREAPHLLRFLLRRGLTPGPLLLTLLAEDWGAAPGPAVSRMIKAHGLGASDARRLRQGLLDFAMERIDASVQKVYQAHLATVDTVGRSHGELIDELRALREPIRRAMRAWDIDGLAAQLGVIEPGEVATEAWQRLISGPVRIDKLTFRFTRHCNIACGHCYNASGPRRKVDRLDDARMQALIAQMPAADLDSLYLSGGEPFLYRDTLLACIRSARSHGIDTVVILTNAFWARSEHAAERLLERLEEAGFDPRTGRDRLIVSSGQYHGAYLDPAHCATLAVVYARRYGRPLDIHAEFDNPRGEDAQAFLKRHFDALTPEQAEIGTRWVSPAGRAEGQPGIALRRLTEIGPCDFVNHLVFDFDGAVRPCCGMNADNEGLVLTRGEWSLADLLRAARNDPIVQRIASEPMHDLPEAVGREPDPRGYVGVCEACQYAIGDLHDTEALKLSLLPGQRFYPFTPTELGLPG